MALRGRGREPEGETDFFEALLQRARVLGRVPSTQVKAGRQAGSGGRRYTLGCRKFG